MDQMVGDRRSPGATLLGWARLCTPSANHRLLGPPTASEHRDGCAVDVVRVGWSCTARRVRRCSGTSYALSRQPSLFVLVAAATSQQNIAIQILRTLRRHVSRPVAAGVSLSAVHIFSRLRCARFFAGEIAEEALPGSFSHLETLFQGSATFVLQGQLPLVLHGLGRRLSSAANSSLPSSVFQRQLLTLFTCAGGHHSSSHREGAWGQCCHVEQFLLQPSWGISLWPSTLLRASLSVVSPSAFQLWRKKEPKPNSCVACLVSRVSLGCALDHTPFGLA